LSWKFLRDPITGGRDETFSDCSWGSFEGNGLFRRQNLQQQKISFENILIEAFPLKPLLKSGNVGNQPPVEVHSSISGGLFGIISSIALFVRKKFCYDFQHSFPNYPSFFVHTKIYLKT
jgi:hypothetical protein